jgi:L-aspartate oxidase
MDSSSQNFVIIGSGIAGMSLAIRLAEMNIPQKIILITQSTLISGSTPLAQGGIASVSSNSDSFQNHFLDTLAAGRKKNNPEAVKILVESAPQAITDLQRWGVQFHTDLHLEGGHSHPRIFNTGDSSGKTIATALAHTVQKKAQAGKIEIRENSIFSGILQNSDETLSISYYDKVQKKNEEIDAEKLFIATGGYSSVFANATTPKELTGSAIAVLMQAGVETKNLDWIQFHPTVVDLPRNPRLLLSEAIRGAGAKIVNQNEEEICDPLLPRDRVSQNIFSAQKSQKIFLDARHILDFPEKFPEIFSSLQNDFALNPLLDLIPIKPAAHYCMGGISTDIFGRTSIKNIFALGECANTQVHGKNRLASNSLLEGLVFSQQICTFLSQEKNSTPKKTCTVKTPEKFPEKFIISSKKDETAKNEMQNICSSYLGIARSEAGIKTGITQIERVHPHGSEEKNMKILITQILKDALEEYL